MPDIADGCLVQLRDVIYSGSDFWPAGIVAKVLYVRRPEYGDARLYEAGYEGRKFAPDYPLVPTYLLERVEDANIAG